MTEKTYNTYISISICHFADTPQWDSGRIYTSVENCKLDLHLDVDYQTARRELAKLMLRTGKMPGRRTYEDMTCYSLTAFLD